MRTLKTIILLIVIANLSLFAQDDIKDDLPKLLGSSNAGTEFYFSFIPCWETPRQKNDLKIYISSTVRTQVKVEVQGRDFSESKNTIPNDIIEFTLTPEIGQPYQKTDKEPPKSDSIFAKAGIHITSDDPIICYAVTRFQYTSDAFLVLPLSSLGKEYIVASYADPTDNTTQWLSSYTSITAAFDQTIVKFTMGGTEWSTTGSGQRPGEVSNWNMNEGDVLLFGSLGADAELTGSKIESTKPVAVVSGNFCAYIPTNCGCCDIIEEMELPTSTWGNEYHVTKIHERKKNSMIKIFAKEPNTEIYRDYNKIGFISDAGGVEGVGHLAMRADNGVPRPIVISGDNPIGVTQFNSSFQDDNIYTQDPFQMTLVSVEQYQTEITFHTPCIDSIGYDKKYLILCYESTQEGTMPEYMEFAQTVDGEFKWEKLVDISPYPGEPYEKKENGKTYYQKTLILSENTVYKVRSADPFTAYVYGFTNSDAFGMITSFSTKNPNINDTIPPQTTWEMDSYGNVNSTELIDYPDDNKNRANLAMLFMNSNESYNYIFKHDEFIACEDRSTNWSLEIIDTHKDAKAVVIIADCNGNDTTITIEYETTNIDESNTADRINIYPNPVQSNLIIENLPDGVQYIELYNEAGKKIEGVIPKNLAGNKNITLDLSTLSAGAYIIKIQLKDDVITKKIMKE